MPKRKLSLKLDRKCAMTVTRVSLGGKKLVYVLLAQKKMTYGWGKSRVVYIGTTKNGMARFAQSASAKAEEVLGRHGVREMDVRIVTCGARQNVQTWKKLERALLLSFRERFGSVPICNHVGKGMKWKDEEEYFTRKRLNSIIDSLS